MEDSLRLLESREWGVAPERAVAASLAEVFAQATGASVYVRSVTAGGGAVWAMGRRDGARLLLILHRGNAAKTVSHFAGPERTAHVGEQVLKVRVCPTDHSNAVRLREAFAFTAPTEAGLRRSFGFGDRLGDATPGHVRAVRGSGLFPVFAQQSIREMERSGRTPHDVMDTASWGVFQCGFRDGFGADADHLKTVEDVDATAEAGFVLYTIDPGDHVDDSSSELSGAALSDAFESLPWDGLRSRPADALSAYDGRQVPLSDGRRLVLDSESVARAAVKYGRAVAHTALLQRRIKKRASGRFELEMSVDETESPTTAAEHAYVALELKRMGVQPVSIAPRFVGRFEKGVDYQGDADELARCFRDHLAIARALGPYKISVHSGSDKFSVYPMMAEAAGEFIHVKTAGTSYLEALRVVAEVQPELFRDILAFAVERYPEDRRTYHVSAQVSQVPAARDIAAESLSDLLDGFDVRQVLHVTYGSVLNETTGDGALRFRPQLMQALERNEDRHCSALEAHLGRHVEPFRRA